MNRLGIILSLVLFFGLILKCSAFEAATHATDAERAADNLLRAGKSPVLEHALGRVSVDLCRNFAIGNDSLGVLASAGKNFLSDLSPVGMETPILTAAAAATLYQNSLRKGFVAVSPYGAALRQIDPDYFSRISESYIGDLNHPALDPVRRQRVLAKIWVWAEFFGRNLPTGTDVPFHLAASEHVRLALDQMPPPEPDIVLMHDIDQASLRHSFELTGPIRKSAGKAGKQTWTHVAPVRFGTPDALLEWMQHGPSLIASGIRRDQVIKIVPDFAQRIETLEAVARTELQIQGIDVSSVRWVEEESGQHFAVQFKSFESFLHWQQQGPYLIELWRNVSIPVRLDLEQLAAFQIETMARLQKQAPDIAITSALLEQAQSRKESDGVPPAKGPQSGPYRLIVKFKSAEDELRWMSDVSRFNIAGLTILPDLTWEEPIIVHQARVLLQPYNVQTINLVERSEYGPKSIILEIVLQSEEDVVRWQENGPKELAVSLLPKGSPRLKPIPISLEQGVKLSRSPQQTRKKRWSFLKWVP